MTKKKPRVGIFMPAYNQGEYIHEALESLKKQTFQDFEVIIADDASTDGKTPDILKNIKYSKARVVFNKTNKGISRQTARFSKLLQNEYFFILCADDKIHPEYIKSCVDYLDSHPKDAAVASWVQCFGDSSDLIKVSIDKIGLPDMLIENNYLGSALVRRKALEDIGYSETGVPFKKHYDYDRWVSIIEKGWSLGVIERPLFYYRRLLSSLSRSINIDDELKFRRAFITKHRSLFEKYVSFITLNYLESIYKSNNWNVELKEGRDWLESQYSSLTKQNLELSKRLSEVENRKILRVYSTIIKLLKAPLEYIFPKKEPKLYAIFAYRYDYELVPGLLENIKGFIDGYIAHDDRENNELWYDEGKIRNSLIEKAREKGADWVLCIDPDERFEYGAGEKIRKLIRTSEKKIFQFKFRELWTPTSYRSDGIWDEKKRPNLFPLLEGQEFMNKRVHSVWHPQNIDYEIIETDINLYHLKNISPEARTSRKKLYNSLDPNKDFQSIGYDYLDDEGGIELTEIPPERLYYPAFDPSIQITQTGSNRI